MFSPLRKGFNISSDPTTSIWSDVDVMQNIGSFTPKVVFLKFFSMRFAVHWDLFKVMFFVVTMVNHHFVPPFVCIIFTCSRHLMQIWLRCPVSSVHSKPYCWMDTLWREHTVRTRNRQCLATQEPSGNKNTSENIITISQLDMWKTDDFIDFFRRVDT